MQFDPLQKIAYDTALSDHYLIYTVFSKSFVRKERAHKEIKFINYRNFSPEEFRKELLENDSITNTDWPEHMLSEKWDKFKNVFLTASNKCAPFETRRLKNRNNPWIDINIVRLIYKRDHLKRKSVKYKSDVLWDSYKQIRNSVIELIRSSKKKYSIEENHSNPKGLWKVLNKLTDGGSKAAPPNKLTAVHFNQYFSSIGSTTISHLITTDDNNTENAIFWRGSNCTSRFDFNDIHLEAVMKQLFALGNTSNNDVLGFDSKLLFLGADIIAPILTKLYNASLTNKIVISDWNDQEIAIKRKQGIIGQSV